MGSPASTPIIASAISTSTSSTSSSIALTSSATASTILREALYSQLSKRHATDGVELSRKLSYAQVVRLVQKPSMGCALDGLRKRIDSIERTKNSSAVVKMRMFAEVLIIESNPLAAALAKAALLRLLALPKFSEDAELSARIAMRVIEKK